MQSHKRIILSINPTLAVMRYMKKMWRLTGYQRRILGKVRFHLGLSNLRYPGGMLEDVCDLLENTTSSNLSPRLVNFLDWVKTQNANGASFTVTLGIPTKELFEKGYTASLYQEKVATFAKLIGKDYAGLVSAIEIGNEYSIGQTTINETTYGFRANIAAKSLAEGFQAAGLSGDNQPDILIQMAEIFGRGSDYKGGNHNGANTAITTIKPVRTCSTIQNIIAAKGINHIVPPK